MWKAGAIDGGSHITNSGIIRDRVLATMPYIAPQLVGIEPMLTVMSIGSVTGNIFVRDLAHLSSVNRS